MIKSEKFFVLDPDHKGGMRKEMELDVLDISSLQKKIPSGLRDIIQEIGFFKPKLLDIPDMLFFVLEMDKVPPLTKDFGYAIYPQNEILFLSVPAQVQAKNYLYYTALYEILKAKDTPVLHEKKDKHDKKVQKKHEKDHDIEQHKSSDKEGHLYNPVLETEKKIYDQSKIYHEDRQKFLEARIGFFQGILKTQHDPDGAYAKQIVATIEFLKGKK